MGNYVSTPKGPMHEVDFGGTGPSLILIHGLGGSTTNWNAVAPALTALGRVRAVDLPGFGLTPPRSDFRLGTHRDSVIAYLETMDGPFTLIGNSTGGLLAELIASARPDLVDRLILVSPATPPVVPDPGSTGRRQPGSPYRPRPASARHMAAGSSGPTPPNSWCGRA